MPEFLNRENYEDLQLYYIYQRDIKQLDKYTIESYSGRLSHLMTWAGSASFTEANKIKPTYPVYLERKKMADSEKISIGHLASICKTARAFFTWARDEYPGRYRTIEKNWIASLRPSRARGEQSELKTREIFTVDEIIKLCAIPASTLVEKRVRAGVAMLFLSGMRIGAFTSIPIKCVDLKSLRVSQLPEKGVLTKNRKAAITTLLRIPELLQVVQEYDDFIRGELSENATWYINLTKSGELSNEIPTISAMSCRRSTFRDELFDLCKRAGVKYKSPHKLRHGHAVYVLKLTQNMAQLKAVSQNMMHSNIGITDGIYGVLVEDDVHNTILDLSSSNTNPSRETKTGDVESLMRELLKKLEEKDK